MLSSNVGRDLCVIKRGISDQSDLITWINNSLYFPWLFQSGLFTRELSGRHRVVSWHVVSQIPPRLINELLWSEFKSWSCCLISLNFRYRSTIISLKTTWNCVYLTNTYDFHPFSPWCGQYLQMFAGLRPEHRTMIIDSSWFFSPGKKSSEHKYQPIRSKMWVNFLQMSLNPPCFLESFETFYKYRSVVVIMVIVNVLFITQNTNTRHSSPLPFQHVEQLLKVLHNKVKVSTTVGSLCSFASWDSVQCANYQRSLTSCVLHNFFWRNL